MIHFLLLAAVVLKLIYDLVDMTDTPLQQLNELYSIMNAKQSQFNLAFFSANRFVIEISFDANVSFTVLLSCL